MGDVVSSILLDSDLGRELIVDCARFREGLLDEKSIRKKYRLTDDVWEKLAEDDALVRAIEDETLRRIRDGSAKREKAQVLVTRAPDVLGKIMDDDSQSARHRIDSAKVLNDFASNGPRDTAPAGDRFIISIVLSADGVEHTEHFNKSIKPDPNDIDPNHPDDMPMIAIAAMKNPTENGGGQPV